MKKINYIIIAITALALNACSNIPDDERLIYVEPVSSNHNVLVEDFTGQKCINCPKAHEAIENVQQVYGNNKVIAVAIHCGLGIDENDTRFHGLMNELGQRYWSSFFQSTQGQPVTKINRGAATTVDGIAKGVAEAMSIVTKDSIQLNTSYDSTTRQLTINTKAFSTAGQTRTYQLWLTEDSIVAVQLMPDGKRNDNYVHNNVLRAAINGDWGENITFRNDGVDLRHTFTLPEKCTAENCNIVAFLYNENGVQQVVKRKIKVGSIN